MSSPKRKAATKSKRTNKFPLSLHKGTGQFYKKISGRFHYFGADRDEALRRYHEQATALHTGKAAHSAAEPTNDMTLSHMADLYIDHLDDRAEADEINPDTVYDRTNRLSRFITWMQRHKTGRKGGRVIASEITTLDLNQFRCWLMKRKKKDGTRVSDQHCTNDLVAMKVLFNWAADNDLLNNIPRLRAVKPIRRKPGTETRSGQYPTFTIEQIRSLLEVCDPQWKAIVLLGINCAHGNTDIANLRWRHVDLDKCEITYPRPKTGVNRVHRLLPATVDALRALPQRDPDSLIFTTRRGNPYVHRDPESGRRIDSLTRRFRDLCEKAGIVLQAGVGFYTLRRSAATIAQGKGAAALAGLLGHVDTRMEMKTYVQDRRPSADQAVDAIDDWMNQ